MANKVKAKSLFDHLNALFYKLGRWESLSSEDIKKFDVYMINRFISMDLQYLSLVNYLQQYNHAHMAKREAYRVYYDLIPKSKFSSKYIKASKKAKGGVKSNLVEFFAEQEECSKREAEQQLELILKMSDGEDKIKSYLRKYGIGGKDLKKYGIK